MKTLSTIVFALFICSYSFSQPVPPKTLISLEATQDFNGKILSKQGGAGLFKVEKDVIVDGKKVVSANTPVEVKLVKESKSDLKIEMTSVKGTDGGEVKLHDCWMYTTVDQNTGKPKGPIFRKGTRKLCYTPQ